MPPFNFSNSIILFVFAVISVGLGAWKPNFAKKAFAMAAVFLTILILLQNTSVSPEPLTLPILAIAVAQLISFYQ